MGNQKEDKEMTTMNIQEEKTGPMKEKGETSHARDKKKSKASLKDKNIKIKESELNQLKANAEFKDKYVRILAEFENMRKRMDREKSEFVKYANEGLITEFLNILDNLERSIDAAKANHQDYSAFLKGIEMVMAQIYEMLKANKVHPIETVGKAFDPHQHEVLMQEESDEVEEGNVIEEFQKGYLLGDRVVRTAKVKVAKNKN